MGLAHAMRHQPANDPTPRSRSSAPRPTAAPPSFTRRDSKPLPHTHRNFIPAQSWLAYNWIDKDPELDFVMSVVEQSGMTLEQIERETEKVGHKVSRHTLYRWWFGNVKRPQNATMSTVMAVCGWERHWTQRAN